MGTFLHGLSDADFAGGSDSKVSAYNARDLASNPGLGRSPGEGNRNPLQYSCMENPMDRGASYVTVHGVTKSRTWLSDITFFLESEMLAKLSNDLVKLVILPAIPTSFVNKS